MRFRRNHTMPFLPNSNRARFLRRLPIDLFMKLRIFIRSRKNQQDLELIRSSDLFNQEWYLANNPDIDHTKMDPALHYLLIGGLEGRNPSPDFNSIGYLDTYSDVRISGVNPLVHYLKFGRKEGRSISSRTLSHDMNRHQFRCPVCLEKIKEFTPINSYYVENWYKYGFLFNSDDFETFNSRQYSCPKCGASDTDRLYALYFSWLILQDPALRPLKILNLAPSSPLKQYILNSSNGKYQIVDRTMQDISLLADNINAMDQEAFDFFICSHVLEQVSDDRKALSELFRILKPGGNGIIMVPINLRIGKIREDPNITDIGERWRRFGQGDLIRLYSKKGFIKRVEEVGFVINQYGIDFFGEEVFFQNGISSKSILYLVQKN